MNAEIGFFRKSTSPTIMLEASAPLGIFFMKVVFVVIISSSLKSENVSGGATLQFVAIPILLVLRKGMKIEELERRNFFML